MSNAAKARIHEEWVRSLPVNKFKAKQTDVANQKNRVDSLQKKEGETLADSGKRRAAAQRKLKKLETELEGLAPEAFKAKKEAALIAKRVAQTNKTQAEEGLLKMLRTLKMKKIPSDIEALHEAKLREAIDAVKNNDIAAMERLNGEAATMKISIDSEEYQDYEKAKTALETATQELKNAEKKLNSFNPLGNGSSTMALTANSAYWLD